VRFDDFAKCGEILEEKGRKSFLAGKQEREIFETFVICTRVLMDKTQTDNPDIIYPGNR